MRYPTETGGLVALLDKAIGALRESATDGSDMAGYYAQFLEHVAQKTIRPISTRRPSEATFGNKSHPQSLMSHHEHIGSDAGQPSTHDFNFAEWYVDPMDGWLTFPFDANLASIGEMGFEDALPSC